MNVRERIEILRGDITQQTTDAIVNAANSSLMGGGGVDGAIHRAGGSKILEECKEIIRLNGKCRTGQAVITSGGNLPAGYVIHTVGPVWRDGNNREEKLLAECYFNSLKLAAEYDCKTIAFPNISTGIYHFPKNMAARISLQTVIDFLKKNPFISKVNFVCFDAENFSLLSKEWDQNIKLYE